MAGAAVLIELLVPVLGVFVNVLMILAPLRSVVQANKDEVLGELNPIPLCFTLINSTTWFSYALAARNPFVFAANDVGILAGLFFTTSCLTLAGPKVKCQIQFLLLASGAMLTAVAGTGALGRLEREAIKSLWGITGNVCAMIYYAAPLSAMLKVIRSRNSASLHILQNVMNALNASLWTIYGLSTGEFFIALPNIPGLACSGLALILCLAFPRKDVVSIPDTLGTTIPAGQPGKAVSRRPSSPAGSRGSPFIKVVATSASHTPPVSPFVATAAAQTYAAGMASAVLPAGKTGAAAPALGSSSGVASRTQSLEGPPSSEQLLLMRPSEELV